MKPWLAETEWGETGTMLYKGTNLHLVHKLSPGEFINSIVNIDKNIIL